MRNESRDLFPATRWSLVTRAASGDEEVARRAFGELCQIYWMPVYGFFRGKGVSKEDAEDLTQGFFAMLIERESIELVDSSKGKLRAFLLTAAKGHLVDRHRYETRERRGGGAMVLSIDVEEGERFFAMAASEERSVEEQFEQAWARTLIERGRAELRASYEAAGKAALFSAIEPFIGMDAEEPPYFDIADATGMSPGALRVAVFRLRQKFRALLEREIADTLEDRSELKAELAYLMGLFSS